MNKLPLTLCAAALVHAISGCAAAVHQSEQPEPFIRIRLAQEAEAPGSRRMEQVGSGQAYFIAAEDVITDEHIQTARAIETATGLNVNIRLTDEGTARLRETTARHMGERLALLVGSRLMSAPVIRAELGSPTATMGLTLPPDEARSVAAAIAARFKSPD